MSETRSVTPYAAREICDYGRLSVLTAFDGGGLHFAQVSLGSLPGGGSPGAVTTPGPGTPAQGVLENTQSGGGATPDVPDSSAVKDTSASSPDTGSAGAVPGSAGGRAGIGSGSGSGSLPFTGMAVGPLAALGAGLTAAGATLRRFARRG